MDSNTGLSQVTITGGTIGISETTEITKEHGNVFGGGKGAANSFECEKGMVYQTNVSIKTSGTVVHGNVYGGGEVSRVEGNTVVAIGTASETDEPTIKGSVFGAGAGLETHGYSALVRGTSTVTVQGKAKVLKNVYGGGEMASVDRYKVKTLANEGDNDVPATLPYGMPAHLINGGTSTVNIQDNAVIGTEDNTSTGHVYGAGQGLEPRQNYDYVTDENYNGEGDYDIDAHKPKRMISGGSYEYFASVDAYLQFVETLALSGETHVTIGGKRDETTGTITPSGSPNIMGSVFGGSESGFVYKNTDVQIKSGTIDGSAFGGGRGLESFAEAGRVRGNTGVTMSNGSVAGNVYGGGNMGDVGTIYKPAGSYDYVWKNTDTNGNNLDTEADHDNTLGNNTITDANNNKNTGICKVEISGGTIGLANTNEPTKHGNVFGAGQGSWHTWWCEKAIAYATDVSVSGSAVVYGNVYGGGEVGRVEDDAKVTIGTSEETGTDKPKITGSVFGGGAGLQTHGYSALVRGNSMVTVQGASKVGGNVYGGGEVASVGRFKVVGGLPSKPKGGGTCTVVVKDNAVTGDVYGSCKGVTPNYVPSGDNRSKSMQLYANRPIDPDTKIEKKEGEYWDYFKNEAGEEDKRFVWVYYHTKEEYQAFLNTLAIASHPVVTIAGSATVYGDVYGGGQRGITLGDIEVNINGGTVKQDVYGGGSLADTNKGNWDNGNWAEGRSSATYKTAVNLHGGTIEGDVYGGGLGQLAEDPKPGEKYTQQEATAYNTAHNLQVGDEDYKTTDSWKVEPAAAVEAVEAKVYGDVMVQLNETPTITNNVANFPDNCVVKGTVFGCNNLNGTPMGDVTVHVYKTQGWEGHDVSEGKLDEKVEKTGTTYELAAVYGGGNLSAYVPADDQRVANVIIDGCKLTSIETVYGGGNAASAPATYVLVNSCYEIGTVFGGGNGAGVGNPGANVGYKAASFTYTYTPDPSLTSEQNAAAEEAGRLAALAAAFEDQKGSLAYGSGVALAELRGGTIHKAFGGSNTLGNVRTSATVDLNELDSNDPNYCQLCIVEVYGAGNEADQDGTSNINLGCISYLSEIYGGAKDADVNSNVVLTIQSGRFDRVFGGNNIGGCIRGSITVNIEETGCHPIIIGQLFGGGNQAGYSVRGYKLSNEKWVPREATDGLETGMAKAYSDPVVNVKSFTSIGEVYGGGYGASAFIVGNPHVNIDEYVGKHANENVTANTGKWIHYVAGKNDDDSDKIATVWQPARTAGAIGTIGNVFGGGNEADVKGDTYVNIGTASYVTVTVAAGTNVDGYYTRSGEGTTTNPYVYTEIVSDTPAALGETYYKKVIGVNITGNVYGGGNAANVTGDTNVVIGKETTTTP